MHTYKISRWFASAVVAAQLVMPLGPVVAQEDFTLPPADETPVVEVSSVSSEEAVVEEEAVADETVTEETVSEELVEESVTEDVTEELVVPTSDEAVVEESATEEITSSTQAPELTTDKPEYDRNEKVTIFGKFFKSLYVLILSIFGGSSEDGNYVAHEESVTTDEAGAFTYEYQLDGTYRPDYTVTATDSATGEVLAQTMFLDPPQGSYNLDQGKNGGVGDPPISPVQWVNGNLNQSGAHYQEGQSVPYRVILTGLPTGQVTKLKIEWDIRQSGKNAIDYITGPKRIAETVDPTVGVAGLGAVSYWPIPAPTTLGTRLDSFNNICPTEGDNGCSLWAYNVNSVNFGPYNNGSDTAANSKTSVVMNINPTASTVVLAWGGHIAAESEWGQGTGATGLPGSPYHMRVLELCNNSGNPPKESCGGGNQDRSLSASAVTIVPQYDPLVVEKTATTSYTRTFPWTIEKTVNKDTLDMFKGDSGDVSYTVAVTKGTPMDSAWAVNGTITITNPNAVSATIENVTDTLSIDGAASVNCGVSYPYILIAGGTLNCTYSKNLGAATDQTNTAEVTTSGDVPGNSGQAAVTFGAPTTLVNDTINVTDSWKGSLGSFSVSGSTSYPRTFTCNTDDGIHDNTATIQETGQNDSASVTVNCYDLTVTKTANTTYNRTYNWEVEKSVNKAELDMFKGDSSDVNYTIKVTKSDPVDSGHSVSGTITITNPAPMVATLDSVTDMVSPAISAGVVCPSLLVPANDGENDGVLNCTYSTNLPDGTLRTNTATAKLINTPSGTTDFNGSANVTFGAPANVTNDEITVEDTNPAFAAKYGEDVTTDETNTYTYSVSFTCNANEGENDNTASIYGDEDELLDSDSASVTVNCYELEVSKTASTSFTRTWDWTIDKTGDLTSLTLKPGQEFTVNYEVTVDAASADDNYTVIGNILVHNPAPISATVNGVSDLIGGGYVGAVVCDDDADPDTIFSFPYAISANATLVCIYVSSLPDGDTRLNTATAVLQNYNNNEEESGTTNFNGTASVNFASAAVNEIDECIDVEDDQYGPLGQVCAGDEDKTFNYSLDISYNDTYCGQTPDYVNVASFVTNDTEETGSDDHTVSVSIVCTCTLTQGYWKTHNLLFKDGKHADPTWNKLANGASTLFFSSGQTWYQIFWTAPKAGNVYYQLAHQYMAAKLNILNDAQTTPAVNAAIAGAESWFPGKNPTTVLKGKTETDAKNWASILGSYNEGLIGPGHCSEQNPQ